MLADDSAKHYQEDLVWAYKLMKATENYLDSLCEIFNECHYPPLADAASDMIGNLLQDPELLKDCGRAVDSLQLELEFQ